MPKKTERKAAVATASAGKKQAVKLEIVLEATPELKPKAKKNRTKKTDAASEPTAKGKKVAAGPAYKPAVDSKEAAPKPAAGDPAAPRAKKKRPSSKPRTAKVAIKDESGAIAEVTVPVVASISDPIGDVSDGEAYEAEDADVPSTQGESEALAETLAEEIKSNEEPEYIPETASIAGAVPPAKLDRLQKILSQAGIASRRHAEEMIVAGRVMVNGQLVTQLGAKADPDRDHIRVDGKLIAGAEPHRYFVLNKPRGYVTTVSDPEGRPTVMQFFAKMPQRLYPVGRLDYLSEGLLLITNNGELANELTRASLGVEKTYLVKVSGRPTEEELDRLRTGVSIERGKPGTERVNSAPAQIREFRQGDNPWFEVVLIEGRNRELRKMFEQIGHFVEKIRRVGYGPLVLDVEPGEFRELTPEEVKALQLTAEGKLKPRRQRAMPTVPRDAGRATGDRSVRSGSGKTFGSRPPAGRIDRALDGPPRGRKPDSRPGFDSRKPERGAKPGFKPRFDNRGTERSGARSQHPAAEGEQRSESRPLEPRRGPPKPFRRREEFDSGPTQRFEGGSTGFRPQQRSQESDGENTPRREFPPHGDKPQFKRNDRPAYRPGGKPDFNRGGKPAFNRGDKPAFKRSSPGAPLRGGQSGFRSERPAFDRGSKPAFERGGKPPFKSGERPEFKPGERPAFKRSSPGAPLRGGQSRFGGERPAFDRGRKPTFDRDAKPPFKRVDRPPFKRSNEAGSSIEGRPSRPPARTFGARPAGQRGAGPSGGRSSGGPSSGRKFGSGAARKPGSRPGGKFKPRGDRKRY